jgi:hypothetical protein
MTVRDFSARITPDSISVHLHSGRSFVWSKGDTEFDEIAKLVRDPAATSAKLAARMDVRTRVANALDKQKTGNGSKFEVTDTDVLLNGEPLRLGIARRIVEIARLGHDVGAMLNFLDRLLQNPRFSAVQELYGFMDACDLPITDDGHFIAYKIVRNDYKDLYSGKFDNSVGKSPEMQASQVDDNRHNTCSQGLHVCSKGYLPHYGGGWHALTNKDRTGGSRVMIVKVDPAKVVSVPVDYNNAKMRVWKYEVIGEITDVAELEKIEGSAVYGATPAYATCDLCEGACDDSCDYPEDDDDYVTDMDEGDDEAEDDDVTERATDAAPANFFVKDEWDDRYYPATVGDFRAKADLYVFDSATGEYVAA